MDAWIAQTISSLREAFHNDTLLIFVISMLPMIEVRGAIPVAVNLSIPLGAAYALSAVSAVLVAPVLMLVFRPLLNALKKTKAFRRLAGIVEQTFYAKAGKIEKKAEERASSRRKSVLYKTLGLFLFVALPLPMTGVWTGAVVAAFLDLDYRYALAALVAGNFTAAGIVLLLTYVLGEHSYIILIVLAVFILISVATLATALYKKTKKTAKDTEEGTPPADKN